MWIARDKNGRVFLYYKKPKRRKDNWHEKGTPYLQLDKTLFPELKWEDNPVEVKLVPSAAEVIVVPSEEEINDKAIDIAMRICGDDYWRDCEEGFIGEIVRKGLLRELIGSNQKSQSDMDIIEIKRRLDGNRHRLKKSCEKFLYLLL